MATHARSNRIVLDVPDNITIEDLAPAEPPRRRARAALPKGPVPLPGAGGGAPTKDPIVAALSAQDLDLIDAFAMNVAQPRGRRVAPAPSRLTFTGDEQDDAIALLEQDGIYSWRYPTSAETAAPHGTRRGPVQERPARLITFDLSVEAAPDAAARRTRGPAADFVLGKVKVFVFRFVARLATGSLIEFLERKKRTGLVHLDVDDPLLWKPIETLDAVPFKGPGQPARILLLVHGTFSSTVGSYGALGVTPHGQAFLSWARKSYDAVIGYDHRTLSLDPLQNAQDLLGRLEHTAASSLEIDAVAFSRGALVLRGLIEYLLPSASLRARVLRAVFVGATNGGTQLASSKNWDRLVDLTTNLVAVGSRALTLVAPAAPAAIIVRESIDTLGALVKVLVTQALKDDAVPGLAAMVPDGRFVTELNQLQPGQPGAAESLYYAVSSDFDVQGILGGGGPPEFPARLARWLADAVVDAVTRESNDLVVNTRSMTMIDPDFGTFIKDRLHFDRNPHVYHTNYFTREEVVRALSRWFSPGDAAGRSGGAPIPANADDRLAVLGADEPLERALEIIRRDAPRFVVARREMPWGETFHYAYRADEIIEICKRVGARGRSRTIERALESTELAMHETTATPEAAPDQVDSASMRLGPSGQRVLIREGGALRAVVERAVLAAAALPSMQATPATLTRAAPGQRSKPPGSPAGGGAGATATRRTRSPPPHFGPATTTPAPVPRRSVPAAAARRVSASAPALEPANTGTIYAAGDMPEQVPLGTVVPLTVTVSQTEVVVTAGPSRATAKVTVSLDRRLAVMVVPKRNLAVDGDDRAEVDPGAPRTDLVFDVKGTSVGPGEIWVMLRQGPVALATLTLRPEVVAANAPVSPKRSRDAATAVPADPATVPYPVLHIFELIESSTFRYHFVLQLGANEYLSQYSPAIKENRGAYVARLYKGIEDRWLSNKDDFDAFQDELRAYGATLFDELMPVGIQDKLWEVRDALHAIQVVAEEPFIPWELVHLKPPRDASGKPAPLPDATHFLAQKGLVRWLHNLGPAPLTLAIRKGRSHYLIPKYPHPDYHLPAAQDEIPYLKAAFGSKAVTPEVAAVRDLLRTPGAVDHFHFSGHGEADAQTAVDAQLLLTGTIENGQWVPRYLKADFIAGMARLQGPGHPGPIVVLNACQVGRAGWRLSSIGGFAESFIRAGAGVFVGSLWSVGDEPAHDFSQAFYKALVKGQTLARAAVQSRNAAAKCQEGTWLAYVVYGYPHAVLTVA